MKFYSILMINIFGWSTSFYPQVNFISHTITTFDDRARSVYVIDVDQVGDNDVLPASTNDNKISWYRNNSVVGVESISNVIPN